MYIALCVCVCVCVCMHVCVRVCVCVCEHIQQLKKGAHKEMSDNLRNAHTQFWIDISNVCNLTSELAVKTSAKCSKQVKWMLPCGQNDQTFPTLFGTINVVRVAISSSSVT